jgi:hypothetical protein
MQTTKSKNRTIQLPNQVVAAVSESQFYTTINKFFESNDEDGHIYFLTELCRAFTGIAFDQKLESLGIANGVFSANVIKDFIIDLNKILNSQPDPSVSDNEAFMICEFLDPLAGKGAIEVLNSAMVLWIHPEEPEYTIEYLGSSIEVFRNITELIRVCNKINNHNLYGKWKEVWHVSRT